jgi:hypothetical protein
VIASWARIRVRTLTIAVLCAGLVTYLYVLNERRVMYDRCAARFDCMQRYNDLLSGMYPDDHSRNLEESVRIATRFIELESAQDIRRVARITRAGQQAIDDQEAAVYYAERAQWFSSPSRAFKRVSAAPWMSPPSIPAPGPHSAIVVNGRLIDPLGDRSGLR